jgi:hypothetical protein
MWPLRNGGSTIEIIEENANVAAPHAANFETSGRQAHDPGRNWTGAYQITQVNIS